MGKKARIVIIGAGMTGLTATPTLSVRSGKGYVRVMCGGRGMRIGGRIKTSRFGGDRIEMGAIWIHGIGGSPVYQIVKEISALESDRPWECMDGFSGQGTTVTEGGFQLSSDLVEPISILFKNLMDFAQGKPIEGCTPAVPPPHETDISLPFASQEFDSPPCPARSNHRAGECEETTEFDRCRSPTGDDFGGGSTQQSSECGSAAPVTVSLPEALGNILSEEICAPDPLPPYPASIKDGYAVIASDGPGEYPVITESRAGNDGGVKLTPGTVAYVTTGGPIPDGADAVVQVEDTEQLNDPSSGSKRVRILVQVSKGVDIRLVGCDIEKDAAVLSAGERIGVSEIGLLATVGVMAVKVYPKPTIAVLSTGDELVEPMTGSLNRGQIRDSNRAMLLAAGMQSY